MAIVKRMTKFRSRSCACFGRHWFYHHSSMVCSRIQIIFQPSSSFYHTNRRSSAGGKGRMGRQDRL